MPRYIDADKIDYTMASVYWGKDNKGKDVYRRTFVAFRSDIDEQPTADVVEVRHGEWMDGFSRQICSVCFYRGCKAFKFCPNCGSKMERTAVARKKKETDLTDRCGSCKWAKKIKGSAKGVFGCYIECLNPNKVWKRDIAKRKQRTNPKCKLYSPCGERREG